ncbi:MAG: polysaccharide deacetylase family protein, partial [Pseudolabrys sp.]
MRSALAIALAISMSAATAAWAQNAQAPAPAALSAAAAPGMPAPAAAKCDNPNALGVARVVEIDTTGGPGFGFEHFKAYDFLRAHEIVLTFDDGPWPGNT